MAGRYGEFERGKPRIRRVWSPHLRFRWECSSLFGTGVSYGVGDTPLEAYNAWLNEPEFSR